MTNTIVDSNEYSSQFVVSKKTTQSAGMVNQFPEERRKNSMEFLSSKKVFKMHAVAKNPNECGMFELEEFDHQAFKGLMQKEDFEQTLNELAECIYGSLARWFDVSDSYDDYYEKICVDVDVNHRFEVEDISSMINTGKGNSRFYILTDKDFSEFCWIVVEHKTLYWE